MLGNWNVHSIRVLIVVGKIEQVKSKFGLGFTAVLTIISSLTMSVGICTVFGLSISFRGRYLCVWCMFVYC